MFLIALLIGCTSVQIDAVLATRPLESQQEVTHFQKPISEILTQLCKETGVACEADLDYFVHVMGTVETVGSISRQEGIKTINDFQHFFVEPALVVGEKMNLDSNLRDSIPLRPFLNDEDARLIPALTVPNLPAIFDIFSVDRRSKQAAMIATSAYLCESPALPGEARACLTSLEAMSDFVAKQMGSNVQLLATIGAPKAPPTHKAPVTIVDFHTSSIEQAAHIVVCHNIMFPAQAYYCHAVRRTKVIEASLKVDAPSDYTIHAVGICHLDTSLWASSHPAFAALNVPNGAEACHWTVEGDLVWVPATKPTSKV